MTVVSVVDRSTSVLTVPAIAVAPKEPAAEAEAIREMSCSLVRALASTSPVREVSSAPSPMVVRVFVWLTITSMVPPAAAELCAETEALTEISMRSMSEPEATDTSPAAVMDAPSLTLAMA